jgi:hypothetical protein
VIKQRCCSKVNFDYKSTKHWIEKSTIKSIAFVDKIDITCCEDKLSNL